MNVDLRASALARPASRSARRYDHEGFGGGSRRSRLTCAGEEGGVDEDDEDDGPSSLLYARAPRATDTPRDDEDGDEDEDEDEARATTSRGVCRTMAMLGPMCAES